MNIDEAVEKACQESTLLKALTYICIWESERVVKQAKKELIDADGKGWDTCFGACLKIVMERYKEKKKPKIGEESSCQLCGKPIRYCGTYWVHFTYSPRHAATPI